MFRRVISYTKRYIVETWMAERWKRHRFFFACLFVSVQTMEHKRNRSSTVSLSHVWSSYGSARGKKTKILRGKRKFLGRNPQCFGKAGFSSLFFFQKRKRFGKEFPQNAESSSPNVPGDFHPAFTTQIRNSLFSVVSHDIRKHPPLLGKPIEFLRVCRSGNYRER